MESESDIVGEICPFIVLIDSNEGHPWTFQGLRKKSPGHENPLPLIVNCYYESLGRYPDSKGDYTIHGLGDRVAIERKSVDDAISTVLGWHGRRERFERELENLTQIGASIVVVEGTIKDCLDEIPSWGSRSKEGNRKIWYQSVISFMQKYRVPWHFAESRRHAEVFAWRWLDLFWRKRLTREERLASLAEVGDARATRAGNG